VIGVPVFILFLSSILAGTLIVCIIETFLLSFNSRVGFFPRRWQMITMGSFFYVVLHIFRHFGQLHFFAPLFSGKTGVGLMFSYEFYLMLGRVMAVWLSGVCPSR